MPVGMTSLACFCLFQVSHKNVNTYHNHATLVATPFVLSKSDSCESLLLFRTSKVYRSSSHERSYVKKNVSVTLYVYKLMYFRFTEIS
uniref:Uncharacterized protein n=1 Tax=Rhipicephalus zambeziensis TaxID=60191 RepID=A0A224YHM4_9ACAR